MMLRVLIHGHMKYIERNRKKNAHLLLKGQKWKKVNFPVEIPSVRARDVIGINYRRDPKTKDIRYLSLVLNARHDIKWVDKNDLNNQHFI